MKFLLKLKLLLSPTLTEFEFVGKKPNFGTDEEYVAVVHYKKIDGKKYETKHSRQEYFGLKYLMDKRLVVEVGHVKPTGERIFLDIINENLFIEKFTKGKK